MLKQCLSEPKDPGRILSSVQLSIPHEMSAGLQLNFSLQTEETKT